MKGTLHLIDDRWWIIDKTTSQEYFLDAYYSSILDLFDSSKFEGEEVNFDLISSRRYPKDGDYRARILKNIKP